MASDLETAFSSSFIETLINSRNRDISLFLPFILGLSVTSPLQETENQGSPRDLIILIDPFTQISSNNSPLSFDSLFDGLFPSKNGHPPASKASIDAMESIEIEKDDEEQCVICLGEWEIGEKAKEMPCKHRFHGECIEKWLRIHGSCPVCRCEMPVAVEDDKDGERRGGFGLCLHLISRDIFSERSDHTSDL